MSLCRLAQWTFCLLFCLLPRLEVHGGDDAVAFVSGFERFARYGDLSDRDAGALLISELSCIACHDSQRDDLQPKMGPRLDGAGNRLKIDWLERHLLEIHGGNTPSTMPDLLHGMSQQEREEASRAIVAFLRSQQKPFVNVKGSGAVPVVHEFWNRGDLDRGKTLYHTIGCVACHEPDPAYQTVSSAPSAIDQMIEQLDPEELADLGLTRAARRVASIPHDNLPQKYTRRSLTMFLLDPSKTRPGDRMPSLRLTPDEAADLAAYLISDSDIAATVDRNDAEVGESLIAQGRTIFEEVGCRSCHVTNIGKPSRPASALPLGQLLPASKSSCIETPTANMPRYSLDAAQVQAIRSTLASLKSAKPSSASERVHHQMLQWNCYACHQREVAVPGSSEREVLGGVGRSRKPYFETIGQVDLGDEGRLPPPLTGVGAKLSPKSLASVFDAKSAKYRRYMKVRMPLYHGSHVRSLLTELPTADEVSIDSEREVFGEVVEQVDPHANVGRQLIGTGCVECHAFGGESLPGVVGIDLDGITDRVRPDWFSRFVLNPGAVKHRTRMPTFFPDGKSNRPDLLDGNVQMQIGSIWVYLKDRPRQPLPEKIAKARAQNYELVPSESPLVLRSFMREAGTHAIAVGFPEGIHYAFDAESVTLSLAWQGRFLDARGTWFERFTPPADPLGDQAIVFPKNPPFRLSAPSNSIASQASDGSQAYRFGGYRLDDSGTPTMLYRFGETEVEDRIKADSERSLHRTWTLYTSGEPKVLDWVVHQDGELNFLDERTVSGGGMTVKVISPTEINGRIESSPNGKQWLVRLPENVSQTIEVQYSW